MKEITVIGSCACRDLFENDHGENYLFKTDIRFSSPISMLSKPVDFVRADFNNFVHRVKVVGTNWYIKNLINDINKTAFDALKEKHGEYLILDLAESRIPLAKIKWKSGVEELLVTNSASFKGHYSCNLSKNIFKNTLLEVVSPLSFDDAFWKETIKEFSQKLLELFNEENIVLIKNMPAKYFVDINGQLHPYNSSSHFYEVCACDLLVKKLYDYFVYFCPRCKVIEIPNNPIGVQNHKWGNHPFHFSNSYYEYLLKCINGIVLKNETSHLDILYKQYSLVFDSELENAKKNTVFKRRYQRTDSYIKNLLERYEEFNALGKRKQIALFFLFDKKHFLSHLKRIIKKHRGVAND